jgi:hypothetical protein
MISVARGNRRCLPPILHPPTKRAWLRLRVKCGTARIAETTGPVKRAPPFHSWRDEDRLADHRPTPDLVFSGTAAPYAPEYATISAPMIAWRRPYRSAVSERRTCSRYILGFTPHTSRTRKTGTRAVALVAHETARCVNLKQTPPMIATGESMRTTMILLLALLAVGFALA